MARLPKPTALLELEKGTLYSDQRDRAALEPKPYRELTPRCPRRFNKQERKAWGEIAAILKNYGLFVAANSLQLELLATAWSQYVEVSKRVSESEIIISAPDGGQRPLPLPGHQPQQPFILSPWFSAQHRLGQLVEKYSQNLGLSSVALAKIGALMLKGKKQKSELEDILD